MRRDRSWPESTAQPGSCARQSQDCHYGINKSLIKTVRISGGQHLSLQAAGASVSPKPSSPCSTLRIDDEPAAQILSPGANLQALDLIVGDGADELMREPRLAEARIADDQDRLAVAAGCVVPALLRIWSWISRPMKGESCVSAAQLPARATALDLGYLIEPLDWLPVPIAAVVMSSRISTKPPAEACVLAVAMTTLA